MSDYNNTIKVQLIGLDEARARLSLAPKHIEEALREKKTLDEIGTVLVASAVKTIAAGGRPSLYKPLAASTIARKKSSKPLIDKGTLRESLDYETNDGNLYLTSVDYLKYHQFEEDRTKAKFPARPVWGVQDEDHEEIIDIIVTNAQKNL